MDAALQEGFHKSGVEGENLFPQPGAHTAFGAAQNTVGSLERKKDTVCKSLDYLTALSKHRELNY